MMRLCDGPHIRGAVAEAINAPQSRSTERRTYGDRNEDDRAGVFSRGAGESFLRRAEAVVGEEVSAADGQRGARRRRRAKPRWPVPGAAFQRLHDGRAALILATYSRSLVLKVPERG